MVTAFVADNDFATLRAVNELRRHLRSCIWIALIAVLGLALAPTVSRAMSAASPWTQICSASDVQASPSASVNDSREGDAPRPLASTSTVSLVDVHPSTVIRGRAHQRLRLPCFCFDESVGVPIALFLVAVGTAIAAPPAQIRTCRVTAYGSCLRS